MNKKKHTNKNKTYENKTYKKKINENKKNEKVNKSKIHIKNTQKNKIKINKKNKSLKGGVFIGKGSYGCVVKPALPCINSKNNTKKFKSYVSKIIIDPSQDDEKDEFIISNKLKEVDSNQDHFITFESYCNIKKIPSNRSNTVSVDYIDNSLDSHEIIGDKIYDKKYCPIDLKLKPVNLIMPYAGYDLLNIIKNKSHKQDLEHYILTKKMLVKNFKLCFKNLLIGLLKMHNIRIVNRDIKNENIMVNYNENTQKTDMRFIDFGLSTLIPLNYKKLKYIDYRGSEGMLAPEIIISFDINAGESYKNTMKNIVKNIKNVIKSLKDYNILIKGFNTLIKELYSKIQKDFENNTIFDKYFGVDTTINSGKFNGYLQKGDIYSLGITIINFLNYYNKKHKYKIVCNHIMHDLLQNMIHPDPEKRFNVIQCLKHKYFL